MTPFVNVIFSVPASSASETILANPLGMPPPPPASQPAAPCLTTVNAHRSVSAALPAPPHPCHDLRAAAPIAREGGPSAACVRVRGVMMVDGWASAAALSTHTPSSVEKLWKVRKACANVVLYFGTTRDPLQLFKVSLFSSLAFQLSSPRKSKFFG